MLLLYQNQAPEGTWSFAKFTFHYASTLSGSAKTAGKSFTNLHSTMLLLYPYLAADET